MRIAAGFLAILLLGGVGPTPEPSASDAVAQAVAQLAAQRHGVTAFTRSYAYEERGPGHDKTLVIDSIRVRDGGKLVAVHLLAQSADGKPASAAELAKLQAAVDKQLPPPSYVLPLVADALPDYRFEASTVPCDGCRAGRSAIRFTSLIRDDSHGDGIMLLDASPHRIASLTFHPSVLPEHADSGTITVRFGQVLPDLWDVAETDEHYTGHVLFIHGWANIVQTDGSYHRYGTVTDALRAIAALHN